MKNDWISIEESMPDMPGTYRVKVDYYGETLCFLSKTKGGKPKWIIPDLLKITHWKNIKNDNRRERVQKL